jgi:membrane associated rhomboid family serine protease
MATRPMLVTKTLMAINIAVFLWVVADQGRAMSTVGVVSPRQVDLGLTRTLLLDGEWYRLVTSGFLHFGVFHLLMNMFLAYLLGQMLEPAVGHLRFGLVYAASLLGGSAGAMLLQPTGLHGGASGAVFGLMATATVGMMRRGVNPFSTGIGTTLALNLVITFTIPGISIGGHLGGAVAGALCGVVVLDPRHRRPHWSGIVAPVAVGAASVLIAVATVT